MTDPAPGYTVGLPKPKRHILMDSWKWLKDSDNLAFILRLAVIASAMWLVAYFIGASIQADEYEQHARAECYSTGGLYASVAFGDDLCYLGGKVSMVYPV